MKWEGRGGNQFRLTDEAYVSEESAWLTDAADAIRTDRRLNPFVNSSCSCQARKIFEAGKEPSSRRHIWGNRLRQDNTTPTVSFEDAISGGRGGSCNIICTQPRRISAMSVGERVAMNEASLLACL